MEERKVSVLGAISIGIAILAGSGMFTIFIIAGYLDTSTPGGIPDDHPAAVPIAIAAIVMITFHFAGIVLGIIGLFQRNTKKLFSVLGTIINLVVFLGTIILLIIGSTME